MSDGSADRPHEMPDMPTVHRNDEPSRRRVVVPVRVARHDFESDLSDRRVIKAVLAVAASLLFGLAVLGWV